MDQTFSGQAALSSVTRLASSAAVGQEDVQTMAALDKRRRELALDMAALRERLKKRESRLW